MQLGQESWLLDIKKNRLKGFWHLVGMPPWPLPLDFSTHAQTGVHLEHTGTISHLSQDCFRISQEPSGKKDGLEYLAQPATTTSDRQPVSSWLHYLYKAWLIIPLVTFQSHSQTKKQVAEFPKMLNQPFIRLCNSSKPLYKRLLKKPLILQPTFFFLSLLLSLSMWCVSSAHSLPFF